MSVDVRGEECGGSVAELVEEEVEEERQFHVTHNTPPAGGGKLRHSATTDTLDSVYLEPSSQQANDVDSDINLDILNLDLKSESPDSCELHDSGLTAQGGMDDGQVTDGGHSQPNVIFAIEGETEGKKSESVPSLSKYFGDKADKDDGFTIGILDESGDQTIDALKDTASQPTDTNLTGETEALQENMIDLTLNDSNDFMLESEIPAYDNENNNHQEVDEKDVKSVDFDLALDKNDTVETPVDIEEEKDAFESFTADIADTEALDALGMSPATPSFLNEKNIKDYFRQTSSLSDSPFNSIGRQVSQTSLKSSMSRDKNAPAEDIIEKSSAPQKSLPLKIEVSANIVGESKAGDDSGVQQTKLETTAKPEPLFPPSTTLSPEESPVHQPFPRNISAQGDKFSGNAGVTPGFSVFPDAGLGDDVFSVGLQMSDTDRQHDAWIASEGTQAVLLTVATHTTSTGSLDNACSPTLIITQHQGDPVRDLVYRYMGEQEALKRKTLSVQNVSPDTDGLNKLMTAGCYRSAIDLTGDLLTDLGQDGTSTKPILHSPQSLQLWCCRFSLMMKLRMYSVLESELAAFTNLDSADLYYEFYPDRFPGKRGSMVPFGMRLLHAELPHHLGRSTETLDRYYYILAVTHKIQRNLSDGLSEDGSALTITADSRKVSQALWKQREIRVYYLIANVLVHLRDYAAALDVYETLMEKDESHKTALLSGLGRIHLQIGNLSRGSEYFRQVKASCKETSTYVYMNKGFEAMCQNNFNDAYTSFKMAVDMDPTNTSAVNNMSVCCLYLGRLKDALKSLEQLVHKYPEKNLHEGILFNLCTLYELESSRALHKKQALLDLVSKHKGDGFPVVCLKMA